jgi:hypothetical protein
MAELMRRLGSLGFAGFELGVDGAGSCELEMLAGLA